MVSPRGNLPGLDQSLFAVPQTRVMSPGSSRSNSTDAVDSFQRYETVGAGVKWAKVETDNSALHSTAGGTARIIPDEDKRSVQPPQHVAFRHEDNPADKVDDQPANERTESGRKILHGSIPVRTMLVGTREEAAPSGSCRFDTLNDDKIEGNHTILPIGSDADDSDDDGSDCSDLSSCKLSEPSDAASSSSSSLADDRETGDRHVSRRHWGPPPLSYPLANTWEQGLQYQNMSPSDLAAASQRYANEEAAAGRPIVAPLPDWSRHVAIPIDGKDLRIMGTRRKRRLINASNVGTRGGSANANLRLRSSGKGHGGPLAGS